MPVYLTRLLGDDPGIDGKSDADELKAFLGHIVPDYDTERVYVSDMKKLASWYAILYKVAPEVLEEKKEEKAEQPEKENKPTEEDTSSDSKVPDNKE